MDGIDHSPRERALEIALNALLGSMQMSREVQAIQAAQDVQQGNSRQKKAVNSALALPQNHAAQRSALEARKSYFTKMALIIIERRSHSLVGGRSIALLHV